MIVDNVILKRLAARFGVSPISKLPEQVQQLLQSGEAFIKAPAGFEPNITGGGYEWDDTINGYRLGQNQKILLAPNGLAIWIFKDILARAIPPNRIQKWVSADDEYPMGKANAFLTVYGKLTGQNLGQNETAGDNVQDGETEPGGGGGLATADDENAPPYSKKDIQNMLKGEFPADTPSGPSMASSIPVAAGEEPNVNVPIGGEEGPSGPVPDRSKVGEPSPVTADSIINTIYKSHKMDPHAKPSKQYPIRVDSDEILALWDRAQTMPPEEKEKLIAFLKSGNIQPLQEGHISKTTLETLMEHIVNGIVQEVEKAKAKSKMKKSEAKIPDVSEPPDYSQMDSEPGAQMNPRSYEDFTAHEKWIVSLANKMWKDPLEIGKGEHLWSIDNKKQYENGTEVYLLKKSKTTSNRRAFAKLNGKWFYFNPEADIEHRKWRPVGVNPPGEEPEPSMTTEMTTTSGGGGSSTGTTPYSVPGAFVGQNNDSGRKRAVNSMARLGFPLTSIGRKEMNRSGDKLYESLKNNLKKMISETAGKKEKDGPICRHCKKSLEYAGQITCTHCGKAQGEKRSGEESHAKRFSTIK